MVPSEMNGLDTVTPVAARSPLPSRPRRAQAASSATVEFSDTLRSQCADVASTLPVESGLTLACAAMPERLPTVVAARLTVIAMELIAAALSSFETSQGGRIEVLFITMPTAWKLTVEHSGPRIAPVNRREFAGAAVVRALITQLGGRLDRRIMIGGERTVVTVPCSHAAQIRVPRLRLVPRLGGTEMKEIFGSSMEAPAGTPLRKSVANAVTEFEPLSSGADENPISQRMRDAGDGPMPPADRPALQGGAQV